MFSIFLLLLLNSLSPPSIKLPKGSLKLKSVQVNCLQNSSLSPPGLKSEVETLGEIQALAPAELFPSLPLNPGGLTLFTPIRGTYYRPMNCPNSLLMCLRISFFLRPSFIKYFIYLFSERGEGKERGRETSMCGCLSFTPHQGPGPQRRQVPWLGIEPVTLWFAGWHSIHWATQARAKFLTYFFCTICTQKVFPLFLLQPGESYLPFLWGLPCPLPTPSTAPLLHTSVPYKALNTPVTL